MVTSTYCAVRRRHGAQPCDLPCPHARTLQHRPACHSIDRPPSMEPAHPARRTASSPTRNSLSPLRTGPRRRRGLCCTRAGRSCSTSSASIALAGERVAIRDGRAIVNGFALDEPYAILGELRCVLQPKPRNHACRIGHVFVLGDNRANSFDSLRRQRSRPGAGRQSAGAGDRYRLVARPVADRALDRHAVAAEAIKNGEPPIQRLFAYSAINRLFGNRPGCDRRHCCPSAHALLPTDGGSRTSRESDMEGTLGRSLPDPGTAGRCCSR